MLHSVPRCAVGVVQGLSENKFYLLLVFFSDGIAQKSLI